MKKILFLILASISYIYSTAADISANVTLANHTATGTYNGYPVFVVSANETLSFGLEGVTSISIVKIDGVSVESSKLDSYPSSELHQGKLLEVYVQKSTGVWKDHVYYPGTTYVGTAYVIINTQNNTTCSKTKNTIAIWHGTISRWERSYDGGTTWTNLSCTTYQYTESSPQAGTAKYRALGTNGKYSDIVTITYVDAVPSTIKITPTTITKTVDESMTLTTDVTDNGYTYQWMRGNKVISNATNKDYKVTYVKSGHAGTYTCIVSNGCNEVTSVSATVKINKCAQTINFPEIPVQTYSSGLTYTLPQKTNKGLVITYQSMNTSVATVSDNILTIKAPGTAVITASQVGDANYKEATQVSRTLTVNKRSQVISFGALKTKTYEDIPFTLPQKTNEGLTISYTSSNTSVATISGNTVTILKPGTTDIIASQAGDATHYAATSVSQTLTVKKAIQTITFNPLTTKTYGDAPFTLPQVSDKNLTITYKSSDTNVASVSGNTITIKKPGEVTITASQAGNAYYLAATSVSQTFKIQKANQTILFPEIESHVYGSADFELPKNTNKGLPISYSSTNPSVATISGNIVHIVGAGSTKITATESGNEYYNPASSISRTLTITKAPQTITFSELAPCTFGQRPISLKGTVNSTLTVEYESSDYSIATIEGNVLTIVGAGQCYITASVPGDANHFTATSVERTLVVNKATPTISFNSIPEQVYGNSPITLCASASTGDAVSYVSSNPSKVMVVGDNAIIQGAGTYTITAKVEANSNYNEAIATQTIVVAKAPLTISANNQTREYGSMNAKLNASYDGLVNGDTKSDLSAIVNVTTIADQTSPVGNYEIVPTASVDNNYNITCKKGVLEITKAPLLIQVNNAEKIYGDANPEFKFKYIGFKNNENSNVLTVQPTAYTTAKQSSSVNDYPVYVSGAAAQNYTISFESGILKIKKAPLIIRAQNVTRKRLDDNPEFTMTYQGFKLNEDESVLDKLPTIQCVATSASPAGQYPIKLLNDGYATNYEYTLIDGVLTIEKLSYTINVASNDNSMGTVTGSGNYDEETIVHISAISKPHCHFVNWNDGDTNEDREIVVSSDCSYTAFFETDKFKIIFQDEDGSVLQSGDWEYGSTPQYNGTTPTKEKTPQYSYEFVDWTPNIIPVVSNATYVATYLASINQYTIAASGKNGEVLGTGTFDYGTVVNIVAKANPGYKFMYWSDNTTYNPYAITVTEDLNLIAYFEKYDTDLDENIDNKQTSKCHKFIRDNQLYIFCDGKVYNALGVEIR